MWILIRKELLENLLTLRLGVALIFCVILAVMATLIGSLDYSSNLDSFALESTNQSDRNSEATTFNMVDPSIMVPPMPLSVLSRGNVSTSGQGVFFGLDYIPITAWSLSDAVSRLMKVLIQIDFSTVVALLLSFLAIVLGFDSICGERQRGTLKEMLSNPVPRSHVVLAKLVGGIVSLCVPFTLSFVLSLLIMLANPDIQLDGDDWLRLTILFGLSCLFLGQIFSLSLMVSALTRDASTALTICLFGWLLAGIGYVSFLPSMSRYGVDEPSAEIWLGHINDLRQEQQDHMEEWDTRHQSPPAAYMKSLQRGGRTRYAHPVGLEWQRRRTEEELNKRLENADQGYNYQWENWEPLNSEARLVDSWAILSPVTNYQVLTYQLARTSLSDRMRFGRLGREYRLTWIEYLRSKNVFSNGRWFTDDPPDQLPMIPDPESVTEQMLSPDSPFMQARMAWAEEQELQAANDDRRQLDLTDMPKFGGRWKRSLGESFDIMMPGLVVLILIFGISTLVTLFRFNTYDPQ
jgi:ABC-type transport system involved in multi-copper enzyme maturation permease subunit